MSVVKWSQRFHATGSAAAKPMGGQRRLVLAGEREWFLTRLAAEPDATKRGLLAELAERKVKVSFGAICEFFALEGITFKKSLHTSEQDRPDVARGRTRWKK